MLVRLISWSHEHYGIENLMENCDPYHVFVEIDIQTTYLPCPFEQCFPWNLALGGEPNLED